MTILGRRVKGEKKRKKRKNKISIFFQNNKNVKTEICKSCQTWCQPGNMYCILCANRLGKCQKCGKMIFDSTYYKYSDLQRRDYLRKRKAKKISTDINTRLIKKMKTCKVLILLKKVGKLLYIKKVGIMIEMMILKLLRNLKV